jgi:hypothetical protein
LGKDAEQMKEHPAPGGAGVNGFGKRDEVGVVLAEEVTEVLHLAEVAGEPRELAEH